MDDLQQGGAAPLKLQLPWPCPSGQHFWGRHLHELPPKSADGSLCFCRLAPLRHPGAVLRLRPEVTFNGEPVAVRLGVEGFFHPFGMAAVATVNIDGAFSLAEVGAEAREIKARKVFQPLDQAGTATGAPVTIDRLLTDALDALGVFGFGAAALGQRSDPF